MGLLIGDRLRQLVKEKNMEQQEVANELGMKVPTFNGYVSNKREPSINRIVCFAEYFNVSIDYLFGYSDIRDPYLNCFSEDMKEFITDPVNLKYLEIAKEIKERTNNEEIKA